MSTPEPGAVHFQNVTLRYEGALRPVLAEVDLLLPEGEFVVVVGETGSGKTTLLRCINGLVPHFTGGTMSGRVVVAGRDTRSHPPRELADVVGVVPQDPMSGFVAEVVEDELAYTMECLGLPGPVMRRRVEEALDLLGLADLRHRPLASLSGGQRQRVAIGAAMTAHPEVLVLDEPTSALDPGAAEDVLAALQRLVHDLGMTVVLAEHRLERVIQYADRLVVVAGGRVREGDPADMMLDAPVAPPVVELGRLAGWRPLPLSVRDARRAARGLRSALPERATLRTVPAGEAGAAGNRQGDRSGSAGDGGVDPGGAGDGGSGGGAHGSAPPGDQEVLSVVSLGVAYARRTVLREVDLGVRGGEVVALMGRNGVGKSSLLAAVGGLRAPSSGSVRVLGADPQGLSGADLIQAVGLVPQDPADLLYRTTVAAECRDAETIAGAPPGTATAILDGISPGIDPAAHPRDLSEGQRLAVALAVVLTASPRLLLLDEPTRGLDYGAKRRLITLLQRISTTGTAVVMATHDVELVAEVASRVVVLADGEIVADGPTDQVVVGSPLFAPQVAKILAPAAWLTVGQVRAALAAS